MTIRITSIFWDEHSEHNRIKEIPVVHVKNNTMQWYYIFNPEHETYLLYHNLI